MSVTADPITVNVYALRDRAGDVLYVGCSQNVCARVKQHKIDQPWASEISFFTIEATAPNHSLGEAFEYAAIVALKPKYNIRQTERAKGILGGWTNRRARIDKAHARGQQCDEWHCRHCRAIHGAKKRAVR
jgi:excinuclease UvrABC nuclease subunit